MRKSFFVKSVILSGFLAVTGDCFQLSAREAIETDTLRISLDDCIKVALDGNPTIKIADSEIDRIDLNKKTTLGQLLPNISFAGQYSRTLAKQTMYMSMDGFGGASSGGGDEKKSEGEGSRNTGIKVGLDNSWSLGFNASLPLIAPQLWATLKLNDTQIMASVESARNSRIQMVREVKNAYFALLLAGDSRKVVESNYDMAL